jgi:hypothetical protein
MSHQDRLNAVPVLTVYCSSLCILSTMSMLAARKLNPPMSGIQLGPVTRTFINTPGAVNGFISAPKRLRMFIIGQVLGLPLTATKTEVYAVFRYTACVPCAMC